MIKGSTMRSWRKYIIMRWTINMTLSTRWKKHLQSSSRSSFSFLASFFASFFLASKEAERVLALSKLLLSLSIGLSFWAPGLNVLRRLNSKGCRAFLRGQGRSRNSNIQRLLTIFLRINIMSVPHRRWYNLTAVKTFSGQKVIDKEVWRNTY